MPTTRSKSASRGARSQSTLSFHGKVTKSHITPIGKGSLKPSQTPPSSQPPKPEVIGIPDDVVEPTPIEPQDVQPEEAAAELYAGEGVYAAPEIRTAALAQEQAKSEAEVAAEKISMSQIKAYWQERENERMAARVHQEDLGVEEKILRLFDTSSHFGPCIGITRRRRWNRAHKLGLNPPLEVLAVLIREDKKNKGKRTSDMERAQMDELMSTKVGLKDVE